MTAPLAADAIAPSMTAVSLPAHGTPDVLTTVEVPKPVPMPNEVVVRVRAAGVNPIDAKTRAGAGIAAYIGEPPLVLGWDVAGEVAEAGPGAHRFTVGDRVAGLVRFPGVAGTYAEFVAAPVNDLAVVPNSVSMEAAGALPMAGLTAYQTLTEGAGDVAGRHVVVLGGAGGVGHIAVQLASMEGAVVTATASASKHGLLQALGADVAHDYNAVPVRSSVADADVVLDCVAGSTLAEAVRAVRPGATIVTLADAVPEDVVVEAESRGVTLRPNYVRPNGAHVERLLTLMADRRLRVVIDRSYRLSEVADAHRAIEGRHVSGKLVLVVGGR